MVSTNILGTEYKIELTDLNNSEMSANDGRCYLYDKKILIRHPRFMFFEASDESKQERFKEVLLHELIHAFSKESFTHYDDNEDLVDWIAEMCPHLIKAYDDVLRQLKELEDENKD